MQMNSMKLPLLAAALLIQSSLSFAPIKIQPMSKASLTSVSSQQPLSAIKGEEAMECYIIDPEEICDEEGCVVGLLDIAKVLYEAISALEKVQESEENKIEDCLIM